MMMITALFVHIIRHPPPPAPSGQPASRPPIPLTRSCDHLPTSLPNNSLFYAQSPVSVSISISVCVSSVTEFSGKASYREMHGFAVREKQWQSEAFRHCKAAACLLGLTGAKMSQ